MVTSKSLGFSIPQTQDRYIEEKIGYGIIDVIRALLAEAMLDKKLQSKVSARLDSFKAIKVVKEDKIDDLVFY